jgi:2'-5' RNA ligase
MSARYAIYLAPAPDAPLWRFGSRVLGRDATTDAPTESFAPPGYSTQAWRDVTEAPRRYGFHATLKAPFRLREGLEDQALEQALAALAGDIEAFDLGHLRVTPISLGDAAFVALTPAAASARLADLEARTVRELDAFRAALTEAEMAKRRPERLTARQRDYLFDWGYPYVLDEYRLHFTLSGPVAAPQALADALAEELERMGGAPHFRVDALSLFVARPDEAFVLRQRFPLRPARVVSATQSSPPPQE